ncbi:MAG TPA: Asp-tRNA(Asn)/Glu-tRNA(Gln) amidotransferase subunit GatB [Planctomycetota bacterium]|nr:Asp-tRNA(Asn)/Glu-tRNA(Gln) amidotransferase subunit GatB [Planctomycetota bacterium]
MTSDVETKSDYRMTIGLEMHVQLKTVSKMFCGCSTAFGAPPNTHVCPVCLGMPGSLPVMNKRAFELAVRTAVALRCDIAPVTRFDRKSYYYPDLPKNYQISQYDLPLSRNGYLDIETPAGERRIGITRVHLEEDAGKLVHLGAGASAVDLNRTGVPLMEIVSEPDIHTIDELHEYLAELKLLLVHLDVSNCNMEEGNIRADANVSVQRDVEGKEVSSPISEIKNMNSFSACEKAMAYEAKRLARRLHEGVTRETHPKETRGWDEDRGVTVGQRQKEEASDYRYFPDPDLAPVEMTDAWLAEIRADIPELPQARKKRFIAEYGLGESDVDVLLAERALADYFEELAAKSGDARAACVWVSQYVMRELKGRGPGIAGFPVSAEALAELVKLVAARTVSISVAQEKVFPAMTETGKSARAIVEEQGLAQVSDAGALDAAVDAVIAKFPKEVADYRSGKEGIINFLMGMVMKETRGKANPQMVRELLQKKLS